jgi:hypothetical protein
MLTTIYLGSMTMSGMSDATTVSSIIPTKWALQSVEERTSSKSPDPPGVTTDFTAPACQLTHFTAT